MPTLETDDGIRLHYEDTGKGPAIVFVHEFGGDHRSWEAQLRAFGRTHRCVAYAARGYPPSDVPADIGAYSQARARDDIRDVLDALDIDRAHVVGLSMGAFATLHFGIAYPQRTRSLTVAGIGYGAQPGLTERFAREAGALADGFRDDFAQAAATYAAGAARVQFRQRDPRGWQEFADRLAARSPLGAELTMRGVQARRPSLYALQDEIRAIAAPTLVMCGDEDWPAHDASLMLKREIPRAGLLMFANAGHAINLEQPHEFNRQLAGFLHEAELDSWPARDPHAMANMILHADLD